MRAPTFSTLAVCLGVALSLAASGCSFLRSQGDTLPAAAGLAPLELRAGTFDLAAHVRRSGQPVKEATIYIEGDGAAWTTPYHPPLDPTPRKPVSLLLAAADPAPAVAYLGRPCQYLAAAALARCPTTYWTERRFAPEVIAAYEVAIEQLKEKLGVERIRLVGYSGGGVIATLLAAQRHDVDALVTVASPLALAEWVKWHGASPLTGSLDPIGLAAALPPGVHFAGRGDKNVPVEVLEHFVRAQGGRIEIVAGFDHECCWVREWSSLLRRVPAKGEAK